MNKEQQIEEARRKNPKRFQYKLYFKHDGCTMLLFKGLTYVQARNRKNILQNVYADWQGHFIITQ